MYGDDDRDDQMVKKKVFRSLCQGLIQQCSCPSSWALSSFVMVFIVTTRNFTLIHVHSYSP